MKHYRQIIIDLAVEDDIPEQKIKIFKNMVEEFAKNTVDDSIVEVVDVKAN